MKILISGYHNPHYLTVTEYIERAVRQLGHELIVFNDRNHVIPGRLRRRWAPLQSISVAVINMSLVRLAERVQPDLIVVTGGHRITRRALSPLIRNGVQIVLWTTDPPRADDVMRKTACHYHAVFCQGTEYVEYLRESGIAGAQWLPMASDPQVHRTVDLSGEERRLCGSDVVFVGSYYPRRAELLRRIVRRGLSIWGPGWEALAAHDPLRACIRGPGMGPEGWVRIYSAAKIVLSIHYRSDDNRFPVFQASPRVFEAMACGAFVLTDRQEDVLELFRDGEHLASFSDGSDLDRKVTHYLDHAEARRRIAAAGRQEVLRHHTYAHRVERLLNAIRAGDDPVDFRAMKGRSPRAPSTRMVGPRHETPHQSRSPDGGHGRRRAGEDHRHPGRRSRSPEIRGEVWCLARGGALAEAVRRSGIRVRILKFASYHDPSNVLRLARHLRHAGADIVHTHGSFAGTFGRLSAILAGKRKIVAHVHTADPGLCRRHILVQRLLAPFTRSVVCVSEAVQRFATGHIGLPVEKCRVVYNGYPGPDCGAPAPAGTG